MNRGLLQALENEAQFAFVMGHEMGHVAARHSAQRQTYGLVGAGLVGLAGLAVGTQTDGTTRALGELAVGLGALGANLVLLRYDRSQELEADRLGVLYMARAGWDPQEAVAAHETLQRAVDAYLANLGKRRSEPGALGALFSTHPRHEVRVEEIQAFIRQIPPGEIRRDGDGRHAGRWRQQTASVRALAPAYARHDRAQLAYGQGDLAAAQRELAEAQRLAAQAPFATLEGAIHLRQSRPADARQAFTRALALYPGYQPALHGLGVVEFGEGRPQGAIPYLEESLRRRPGFAPSHYVLGLALARGGQSREAIPHLDAVARANPEHPTVHGLLAQLHEATGNPRAAAAAWQAQRRAAPDSELGRRAEERLRTLGAALTEPYQSRHAQVRLLKPGSWTVDRDGSGPLGGELVLKRTRPDAQVRVATRDYRSTPDLPARLDEAIRTRLGGRSLRVVGESGAYRLGGRSGVARTVRYGDTEHLFVALARGGRVWWVDVRADRDTWRDAASRQELHRLLDSLDF
jgi:predicted Zn-dependent protease